MTLDEAIQHCEEVAEENEKIYEAHCRIYSKEVVEKYPSPPCKKCADEHRQLAEWLKELKAYRVGESRSEIPNTYGDAISREAAVNAIYDLCGENVSLKENPWRDNPHMDAVVDALENLPSVTPQQRKTQMLDESNFDVNQYEMDLQSAYDCGRASTQQRTGRWIPVSERLPKKTGIYLISIGDLVTSKSFDGHNFRTESAVRFIPDAWMPLPEPYKAESEVQDADSD